ncbi:MAG TPA: DUF4129 domain-containing protein [Longimicrobiales bacterium]|nr:DUF4129 domain-containing protein [Longimicrobiales bacterium]
MTRALLLVLLVVAVSAVVALAAPGVTVLRNPLAASDGWARAIRLAGIVAAAAGVAGLIAQRRRLLSSHDRHYDPAVAALATAGTIMGILALLAFLAPATREAGPAPPTAPADQSSGGGTQGSAESTSPASGLGGGFGVGVSAPRGGGAPAQPGSTGSAADDGEEAGWSGLQRSGIILLLVLLIATVVICLRILSRGRHHPDRELLSDAAIGAADAEAGLEASLGAVMYEGNDPREQITAAYHRLLGALAAAGVPRAAHEAPHEHLHRALAPLGVSPEPMHHLTALYVIAQFSDQPVSEQHRAAAADALERALASLRAANPAAADGTQAPLEQSYA